MISHYTWPNYNGGGTIKDGVRALLNDNGFSHDVQYGHSKLFIRSPQTLSALEKVREMKTINESPLNS